jgi:hypothetical protein
VYEFSGTTRTIAVSFTKSGTANARINYFAYPGETPIFDLFDLLPNDRVTGFDVRASYIHIRGMEIRGTQQIVTGDSWSVRIRGDGNIIEAMNVHDGEAPGFFITSGANNLILNCDSHHNFDPLEDGGNADGFGCHSTGSGNVISGCRGYWNSDDGYDFINAPGACTVENSWAFNNGYEPETNTAAGNGAGFKAGGYGLEPSDFPSTIPRHVVRNCVAFGNRAQGFYANHHPGGINFFNNTAFGNGTNFNMLADVGESDHTIRNNVALMPGGTITQLSGGTDDFNSWSLGVTVTADDFLSTMEEEAIAPRQADGSLPNVNFMKLAEGSDLIDQGEDVGLPFAGSAPDLGAFEFGLSPGSGGMAGQAGAGATAGGAGAAGGTAGASGASAGNANGGAGMGGGAGANGGGPAGSGGGAGTGGTPSTGGVSGTGASGGTAAGTPSTAGMPSSAGAPSPGGAPPIAPGDDTASDTGGCGCRLGSRSENAWFLSFLALIVPIVRRRRRVR